MKAIARNSDPSSSHAAALKMNMSGRTKTQADAVLKLLGKRPVTASVLEQRAESRGVPVDRYAISRRLPELEEAKKAVRCGIVQCAIRMVPMQTWRLAE